MGKLSAESPAQKKKKKFRQSSKWKSFRHKMKDSQNGFDLVTNKKLYKGYTVHHLDLDVNNYENITNKNHFLACNKKTHDMIHWLWTYYQDDEEIISRLESVLISMKKINKE